jgi:hypothetical protein
MQSLLLFFKPWCLVLAQFSSIYLFNLSYLLSGIRTHNISGDLSKSNYHTTTTTSVPDILMFCPLKNIHSRSEMKWTLYWKRYFSITSMLYLVTCGMSWLSPGTPVSSTNKTYSHDIIQILLKVALNTINQTKPNQTLIYNQPCYLRQQNINDIIMNF